MKQLILLVALGFGAVGAFAQGPFGVRQVCLQDPDGNWIEINDAAYSP